MKVTALIALGALILGCANPAPKATETTAQEKDWEVLFDGTSTDKWKQYNSDTMSEAWKIEDGALVFYPPKKGSQWGKGHNIVTKENYHSFELVLEYKVAEGANSGIFWGIIEDERLAEPYLSGPEIQVLDNERHPDAKAGLTHQAGALYDMVAPSKDVTLPAGEWNTLSITIDYFANQGVVIQNGEEIVNFPVHGEGWNELVANSKFADWAAFGKYRTGKIGLQDHGDVVAYRNIKIRRINAPNMEQEPTTPEATELYEPVPPKVTPGANGSAPSDAIVLFDGTSLDAWESANGGEAPWILNEDGSMTVADRTGDIRTKEVFGSVQLHLEWRSPADVRGSNQSRANSGVYLQEKYEVQVLDNNDNPTYVNGQVGSIYKQAIPLAMASVPSGEWNTYDIIFHAPEFDEAGNRTKAGTLTVIHNGVLIQDHYELKGTTEYIGWPKNTPHGPGPLRLQDHGDNSGVSYRNIWIRPL